MNMGKLKTLLLERHNALESLHIALAVKAIVPARSGRLRQQPN
jgi:hypothetical protein